MLTEVPKEPLRNRSPHHPQTLRRRPPQWPYTLQTNPFLPPPTHREPRQRTCFPKPHRNKSTQVERKTVHAL